MEAQSHCGFERTPLRERIVTYADDFVISCRGRGKEALASHTQQGFQGVLVLGRVEPIVGKLGLPFDAAPYKQPVTPAILFPAVDQSPVIS